MTIEEIRAVVRELETQRDLLLAELDRAKEQLANLAEAAEKVLDRELVGHPGKRWLREALTAADRAVT